MENNRINFYDYIENRLPELYKDGIILLDPLSKSKMWHVFNNIKKFSDVSGFTVGADNHQLIVLKHSVKYNEFIDIRKLYNDAYKAYEKNDFETCIAIGRRLLTFTYVSSSMYAKIGISYMQMGHIDTAIKYLTVATEISKKDHISYDYTDIILSLRDKKKNMRMDIEIKPMVKMSEDDFKQDNYDINNLADIAIDFSAGLSLDEIAKKWNLDTNQMATVLLVFAKQYYCEGNDIMGDKCLKWVERLPEKQKTVLSLYKEAKTNKPVYLNKAKFGGTNTEDNSKEKKLSLAFRAKI